jgi:hypothetical protein
VDLPPDQKVAVVQFDTVVPTWTADNLAGKTAYEQSVLFQDALQPFLMEWCSLESVSARLDYHPNTP